MTQSPFRRPLALLSALLFFGMMARAALAREPRVEKDVVYGTVESVKLLLDVYQPEAATEKLPGVVLVHGGGWQGGDKAFYAKIGTELASKGYVAFSVNYRLAPKFHYPAQLDDVQRAVRWIRAHADAYHLDPERLGAIGDSAGGYLVAMLGTRDTRDNDDKELADYSSRVQCVVDYYGPTDFTLAPKEAGINPLAIQILTTFFGKSPTEAPDLYREGSPITYVSMKSAPFLILHGDKDPLVPLDQSHRLNVALIKAGVKTTFVTLPNDGHGFQRAENQKKAHDLTEEFLDRCLKPHKTENAKSSAKAVLPILNPVTLNGLTFQDVSGKVYGVTDIVAHPASVFLFVSAQCPISNLYAPRLARLASTYGKRGVAFYAVYANEQERLADIMRHARQHGLTFPVVRDVGSRLADHLGASLTPEAVALDAGGTVRYRGRIDDNSVATRVTSSDLKNALDALLEGRTVPAPRTLAFGCAIRRAATPVVAKAGVPTYARDVAPILRGKCEGCHRPGEVAPFTLQTYRQARAWAADIKRYTQSRQMPPWKPASGYGEFQDEAKCRLTDTEIATLARWADAGAPQGDPKRIPPPRKFVQGWQLGEPDLVLQPDRDFHLAAEGEDVYRNFIVKTDFPEDCYVRAVEVRPGNNAVVHHVINYIDGNRASDRLEGKDNDGEPGYTSFGGPGFLPTGMMGGWAPGNDPHFLPEGVGTKIPKGARIVIQVHYHKTGKPETDRTRVGVYFARSTVNKGVVTPLALNFSFLIPPGAARHEVRATRTISEDMHALAVMPHMHWLGREIKVWATLPDGAEKPLVWIKDWDFNWQATYLLKTPVALPAGTKIQVVAYYDNSDKNPRNPNRANPRPVTFGEATSDEMCVAFLSATRDHENLGWKPNNTLRASATPAAHSTQPKTVGVSGNAP